MYTYGWHKFTLPCHSNSLIFHIQTFQVFQWFKNDVAIRIGRKDLYSFIVIVFCFSTKKIDFPRFSTFTDARIRMYDIHNCENFHPFIGCTSRYDYIVYPLLLLLTYINHYTIPSTTYTFIFLQRMLTRVAPPVW